MPPDVCCPHCLLKLGFSARRKRVLVLLVAHPELDQETFRGVLIVETEGGGRARGHVTPQPPMIEPEHAA